MYVLYGLLSLMLFSSLCLLAIPFIRTQTILSMRFLFSSIFVIVFSLGIYSFSQNHSDLKQWLTQGEKHYQLQVQVKQLGGFAGIIERIKKKLATNPNDAEGWFILGKLYFANRQYKEAKDALDQAVRLQPENPAISRFYTIVKEKAK